MPPPSVGWLTTTARTTSYGAPKPSVGWLTTSPTPTSTSAPPPGIGWLVVGVDSWMSWETEYVVGTFLPTLLASIFAIPWKILDHDTKTLVPFAQLARPGGGPAAQTILLHYDGISGLVRALAAFVSSHHAPVALSTFLRYSAALLSPLAAESVRLGLQGACLQDWKAHCTATLRASESVILFTQVLLSLMGCAVFAYLLLMGTTWRNRGFGVYSDPRSIVGIASLSLNPFLSAVLRAKQLEKEDGTFSARRAARVLGSTRFELGYVSLAPGIQEYAILVSNVAAGLRNNGKYGEQATRTNLVGDELVQTSERHRFAVSGLVAKLAAFCLFLVGLIFLILWYRLAPNTDTAFEGFMDSQSTFGVRFLFTCFGRSGA
ncbi:hypothetical protein BR93DRAFT_966622 [Coniochaeta sp. PMI_546]|nr:hypothetical protein BR93DRAFT_966622 [Coniochaeta sp. PMI_546]